MKAIGCVLGNNDILTDRQKARQAMYVKNIIEVHSCNQFCSRKAISITYVKCVFVALGIQRAMRLLHIAICGLPGSTIFSHIISFAALFSKKKVVEYKTCVLILSTILKHFLF